MSSKKMIDWATRARVVKMSESDAVIWPAHEKTKPTPEQREKNFRHFFEVTLPRDDEEKFHFSKSKIGKTGLSQGDTFLIQFLGQLRCVGKTLSGRIDDDTDPNHGPHFFKIDMQNFFWTKAVDIKEVQRRLREEANYMGSLRSQGWNDIPGTEALEKIIQEYIEDKVLASI